MLNFFSSTVQFVFMIETGSYRTHNKFNPPGWSGWPNPATGQVWPCYESLGKRLELEKAMEKEVVKRLVGKPKKELQAVVLIPQEKNPQME